MEANAAEAAAQWFQIAETRQKKASRFVPGKFQHIYIGKFFLGKEEIS